MPSTTYTTPGTNNLDIAGKHNFTFQVWSTGGKGESSAIEDCGGGGGGGYVSGTIPDADLIGSTTLDSFLPDPDTEFDQPTTLSCGSGGLSVLPGGEGGDTTGGAGGDLDTDTLSWVSVSHTGGAGANHPSGSGNSSGSGGGSSAGTSSNGNVGVAGGTTGASAGAGGTAVTGGGAGGAGGTLLALGTNGSSPGGGGGGAGDQEATEAKSIGGNAKVVITYDTVTPAAITSNGAGATASVNVASGNTAVTTVTATGTSPILFSITGGNDADKFSVDGSTGVLEFQSPPDFGTPTDVDTDNVYEVEVTAANGINGDNTDTQLISVTVTGGGGSSGAANYYRLLLALGADDV